MAGLLFGLLREMPLPETVRLAAACGALVTLKRGAIPALPRLATVHHFIGSSALPP